MCQVTELCGVARDDSGRVSIRIECSTTAAARRLLIDATYSVQSLEDIDAGDAPPTNMDHLAAAGVVNLADQPPAAGDAPAPAAASAPAAVADQPTATAN